MLKSLMQAEQRLTGKNKREVLLLLMLSVPSVASDESVKMVTGRMRSTL